MKTIRSRALSAVCCIILWPCCSVKENRDACPCRLYLDFAEGCGDVAEYACLTVCSEKGFAYSDKVGADGFAEEYMVLVPRGGVMVNAYYGADDFVGKDGGMIIPLGDDCPRVYMYSSYVSTGGDVARTEVSMRKNHCLITVHVEESEFPYSLNVRGDVAGYDSGGNPSGGEFSCMLYPDDGGKCMVSVPRQKDRSLVLDVDDGTDVLKTFALGEYVAASGYDWTAENLEDITIGLDYSLSQLTLKVEGWSKELHFDVEI